LVAGYIVAHVTDNKVNDKYSTLLTTVFFVQYGDSYGISTKLKTYISNK